MKKKILLFSTAYLPFIGGAELALKEITDRLDDFEFSLITSKFRSELPDKEKLGNINIYRVGFGNNFDKFLLPILGYFKAKEILKKEMPSLVHAYQASYGAGAAWLLKKTYPKLPLLLTIQEGKELSSQGYFINFIREAIIKKADSATAISRYLKNYISAVNKNLKIDIVPNGVDIDKFSREFSYGETSALEEKLGVMPDDKVIISVSRLVPKNGVDLLIKAMSVLSGRGKYKLILVGEGPEKENLSLVISHLSLQDNVIFAGSVNHHDLPLYLKISDVFVRPSRSEGLGNAFLEAMAAGVPVIGTKVGGIPDFLEDRKTGLFAKLEPEDIAFNVRIIMENESLRNELISNAKKLVSENYSWNKIAEEFRKIYNEQ
jgi:glycosyltransferase involved in cell wall biosynthesis